MFAVFTDLLGEILGHIFLLSVQVLLVQLRQPGRQHVLPAEQVMVGEGQRVDVHIQLVVACIVQGAIDVAVVKLMHDGLPVLDFQTRFLFLRNGGSGWGGTQGIRQDYHPTILTKPFLSLKTYRWLILFNQAMIYLRKLFLEYIT